MKTQINNGNNYGKIEHQLISPCAKNPYFPHCSYIPPPPRKGKNTAQLPCIYQLNCRADSPKLNTCVTPYF